MVAPRDTTSLKPFRGRWEVYFPLTCIPPHGQRDAFPPLLLIYWCFKMIKMKVESTLPVDHEQMAKNDIRFCQRIYFCY